MKKLFVPLILLTLVIACSHKSKEMKQEQQVDEAQRELREEEMEINQKHDKQMQEAHEDYQKEVDKVKYKKMNDQ